MANGTDKRQRNHTITVRLSAEERAQLEALSSRSGLAAGAFMRAAAFGGAGPRARRRRPVEHRALVQALAALNRVGNNLNQIARSANLGLDIDMPELRDALHQYRATVDAIYSALGMEPAGDHQGKEPGWS